MKAAFAMSIAALAMGQRQMLHRQQDFVPDDIIVNIGNGDLNTALFEGATGVSDDEMSFMIALRVSYTKSASPSQKSSYGIALNLPIPDSADEKLLNTNLLINEGNLSLSTDNVSIGTFKIESDCKVTGTGVYQAHGFDLDTTKTCITDKKAYIVLKRGRGGALDLKTGSQILGANLSYLTGDDLILTTSVDLVFDSRSGIPAIPAAKAGIGINEQEWTPQSRWIITNKDKALGSINAFTSLEPIQLGQ